MGRHQLALLVISAVVVPTSVAIATQPVSEPDAAEPYVSGFLPSDLTADPYMAQGFQIDIDEAYAGLSPGKGRVFIDAHRRHVDGNIATDTWEFIDCACSGYHFDPFAWTAAISMAVHTEVVRTRSRIYPDYEKVISRHARPATGSIRLAWTGHGKATTTPYYDVGTSYSLIAVVYADVGFYRSKEARVTGTIRFNGLGITARMPSGEQGEMTYGGVVGN